MNHKTILLVEDNLDDEALTRRALLKNGITNKMTVAHDGQQAIDYFFDGDASTRPVPAVVLLDMKLPKFGGLEVLRRIRTDERTRFQPVVILTSSKEEQDIVSAYRLGINSYIRKPVDFTQFMESIRQIVTYWLEINEPAPVQRKPPT